MQGARPPSPLSPEPALRRYVDAVAGDLWAVGVMTWAAPEFPGRVRQPDLTRLAALRPAVVFVFLSTLFGNIVLLATPPLRGPDETAHFLRAYGISMGEIVPSSVDQENRKGILLPARVYQGFAYFEGVRVSPKEPGFGYGEIFRKFWAERGNGGADAGGPPVFVRYEGSEGYSPAAYLPQALAALAARAAGLDFLATFYLMRFAGLTAMTAVLAYAIALAGSLGWAFLGIAMLPAAVYGRAVINADAAALAYAMVVTGLVLRASRGGGASPGVRATWLTLCALSKPPNLAFVLFELLASRSKRVAATVLLPAFVIAILWTLTGSADVAVWRLAELTGVDPIEFDPIWKLKFLLQHPTSFPAALIGTFSLDNLKELWLQLIGVLGLFDTVLQWWVYPAVTLLAFAPFFVRSGLAADCGAIAAGAGLTLVAYALAVFAIFYLVWTPVDAPMIWGVQGRYFLPALPLAAIVVAVLSPWRMDERLASVLASAGAILAGSASFEAILRTDWNF
jgi:hypothetical protein